MFYNFFWETHILGNSKHFLLYQTNFVLCNLFFKFLWANMVNPPILDGKWHEKDNIKCKELKEFKGMDYRCPLKRVGKKWSEYPKIHFGWTYNEPPQS